MSAQEPSAHPAVATSPAAEDEAVGSGELNTRGRGGQDAKTAEAVGGLDAVGATEDVPGGTRRDAAHASSVSADTPASGDGAEDPAPAGTEPPLKRAKAVDASPLDVGGAETGGCDG